MKKYVFSFDDFKTSNNLKIDNEDYIFDSSGTIVKSSDLKLSINANKYDEVIDIVCSVTGEMAFECSRCLELFKQKVNINFEYSFTKEESQADITDIIEQNIVLNIPMKPLCSADCKGICQVCGNNRNIKDCNCQDDFNKEFIKEKWKQIQNNWGKYAKSKKKTHTSS